MKKFYLCLLAIITLLSFSSCSEKNSIENDVRKEVKVTATFNGMSSSGTVTTRAVDNSWENGDVIGLFMKKAGTTLTQSMLANNVRYTNDGTVSFKNQTENKVYFPFDKSNVDFIAYYPYTENLTDFIYKVDVSNQSNLGNIDLMYSDNVIAKNYTDESIKLDFKHQLTKIVLKVANNNSDNTTGNFTAKITNARKNADFSLIDGSLTFGDEVADISFNVDNTTNTAEAILLPTTDLTNKEFVITVGDISYSYSLKNSDIKSFASSTKCEYSITIEPNDDRILNNVTASITDWITVKEDIVADEVPSNADNGNTEPEGEVIPPASGDGEGGEPTEPEGGDSPVLPDGGDGTQEKPFTIAQTKDLKQCEKVWIKGYIVGSYKGTFEKFISDTGSLADAFNIALADFTTEELIEEHLYVDLDTNKTISYIQKELNLNDNSENSGRKVSIYCDVSELTKFGGKTIFCVTKVRSYSFVDE